MRLTITSPFIAKTIGEHACQQRAKSSTLCPCCSTMATNQRRGGSSLFNSGINSLLIISS
jgi:hypothetical protein